jgi:hypothetical protein
MAAASLRPGTTGSDCQAVAEAEAKLTYELAAKTAAANGTSDRSVQNEISAIEAFK